LIFRKYSTVLRFHLKVAITSTGLQSVARMPEIHDTLQIETVTYVPGLEEKKGVTELIICQFFRVQA